jgi:hypothetical protein
MIDGLSTTGRSFAEMAASYIDLANTQGRDTDYGAVNGAFLHAAARYSAFVIAVNSSSKEDMETVRNVNLDQITADFRGFLEQHYSEYVDNFDTYLVKSK